MKGYDRRGGGQGRRSLNLAREKRAPGVGRYPDDPTLVPLGGGGLPLRLSPTDANASFDNDPSAGSPTETLLRLLLPLNDQV